MKTAILVKIEIPCRVGFPQFYSIPVRMYLGTKLIYMEDEGVIGIFRGNFFFLTFGNGARLFIKYIQCLKSNEIRPKVGNY